MTAHKVRTDCCNHTHTTQTHNARALSCGSAAAQRRIACISPAARLRLGCGSAARHGFGSAAAWRAAALSVFEQRRSSRAARAPKLRVARTTAIDRRLSRRTRRAPPASGGRANGELSPCGWPRARSQQHDACVGFASRSAARSPDCLSATVQRSQEWVSYGAWPSHKLKMFI